MALSTLYRYNCDVVCALYKMLKQANYLNFGLVKLGDDDETFIVESEEPIDNSF